MLNWTFGDILVVVLVQSLFTTAIGAIISVNLGREKETIYLSTGDSYTAICLISATDWTLTDVKVFFDEISFNVSLESCTRSYGTSLSKVSYYCSSPIPNITSKLSNLKGEAYCTVNGNSSTDVVSATSAHTPFEVFISPTVSIETALIIEEKKYLNISCTTTETNWINPIMTFSIKPQLYSVFLTCTSIDGNGGGQLHTCTGTIGGFDRIFNKKSAICVFETFTKQNLMETSVERELTVIFAPEVVTVGVTPALVMYKGIPYKTHCELSETTWVEPFIFFGIESNIYPAIPITSCTNTTEANGGYKYTCPITLPGNEVTSDLINKNAACLVYDRSTFDAKSALPKIIKILIKVTPILVPTSPKYITNFSVQQVSTTSVPITQVPTLPVPTISIPTSRVSATLASTVKLFKAQISLSQTTTLSPIINNFQGNANSNEEIKNLTTLESLTTSILSTQVTTASTTSTITTIALNKEASTTKVTKTEASIMEASTTKVAAFEASIIDASTIKAVSNDGLMVTDAASNVNTSIKPEALQKNDSPSHVTTTKSQQISSSTTKVETAKSSTVTEASFQPNYQKSTTQALKMPNNDLSNLQKLSNSNLNESTSKQASKSTLPLKSTLPKLKLTTSSIILLTILAVVTVAVVVYLVKLISHTLWIKKMKATDKSQWSDVIDEELDDSSFKRVKISF